jgi:exodeoxyribonuclease V alpha subunit
MSVTFELLCKQGLLRDIDIQFSEVLRSLTGEQDTLVQLGAALASAVISDGHICADLPAITQKPLKLKQAVDKIEGKKEGDEAKVEWPDLETWVAAVKSSSAVSCQENNRPLYLDAADRLYLNRYWAYQTRLVRSIRARLCLSDQSIDLALLKDGLVRLFDLESAQSKSHLPWQAIAAVGALRQNFCVISGGPGTGKTSTVVRILALLFEQAKAKDEAFPRVILLAPTGKAASRMEESIRQKKGQLNCEPAIIEALPQTASTIHRGLKSTRQAGLPFQYHRENPLPFDVVIVDEASMISFSMMTHLMDAVPKSAKLVLLGDEHQLASVQAGAILGDICHEQHRGPHSVSFGREVTDLLDVSFDETAEDVPSIRDAIIELKQSHRFDDSKGIGALARAIKAGDSGEVLELLKGDTHANIHLITEGKDISEDVQGLISSNYASYLDCDDPLDKLNAFNQFRVLCAHRRGDFGSERFNTLIASILAKSHGLSSSTAWYPQLPVMVTKNDYRQSLFNGDIGIIARASDDPSRLVTQFPGPGNRVREFSPSRLPAHEPVFAMTIHKSQGSEFNRVLVVLPKEVSPILSRELLYTAVTRAASEVFILANEDVIKLAVKQEISRASGLSDLLWA